MTEGHVFSHETAAALYGMPLPRSLDTQTVHVSAAPEVFPPQSRGVVGHATSLAHRFRILDELPVIEPAIALLQLAPRLSHLHLVRAGDFLLQRREPLCDWQELQAVASAAAGARGIRSFRRALDDVRAGTDSPRETDTRLALTEGGLPEPVIGYRILSAHGLFLGTPDLAYPRQRVAIEYEGAYHREEEQFAYDIRRRELMEDAGWAVIRVISQHLATPRERSRLVDRVRNTLTRQSRLLEL